MGEEKQLFPPGMAPWDEGGAGGASGVTAAGCGAGTQGQALKPETEDQSKVSGVLS